MLGDEVFRKLEIEIRYTHTGRKRENLRKVDCNLR